MQSEIARHINNITSFVVLTTVTFPFFLLISAISFSFSACRYRIMETSSCWTRMSIQEKQWSQIKLWYYKSYEILSLLLKYACQKRMIKSQYSWSFLVCFLLWFLKCDSNKVIIFEKRIKNSNDYVKNNNHCVFPKITKKVFCNKESNVFAFIYS